MTGLSAAATLDLWELAERLSPVERTLALAAVGEPPAAAAELAALPLGRRDARLLRLHRDLTGPALEATAACPECGAEVEFAADVAALLAEERDAAAPEAVAAGGFVLTWRPPDSRDFAAAAAAGDAAAAERALLERCVTSASGPEGEILRDALPPDVREAVARAMGAADPLAEVLVDLACPGCGTAFEADLDVSAFVWAEVRAHAQRLLREVDLLAHAYGWGEEEVLELGDERRAAYVQLVREGTR
jgi:pyruvate/2-oxoglutarate dehydrogenase complex dihydrolipoamide acyltransferase (E2) component